MTNDQFIVLLHPAVRHKATEAIAEANRRLTGRSQVEINFTLRTIAEQDALYAQGRTTPGKIVTNAKGGQSYHNYGLAFDIDLLIDGKKASWDTQADWDGDKQSDWMEVVAACKLFGWKWGGDWRTFKDMPHFEMTFGYHWSKLMTMPVDENGYVKLPL